MDNFVSHNVFTTYDKTELENANMFIDMIYDDDNYKIVMPTNDINYIYEEREIINILHENVKE